MSLRNKIAVELLHQTLGHKSKKSLMARDTTNFWQDIELKIYQDTFLTSFRIFSMNKKARSKNILKLKAPFKWVL